VEEARDETVFLGGRAKPFPSPRPLSKGEGDYVSLPLAGVTLLIDCQHQKLITSTVVFAEQT